jgi:hypothetical protein
MPKLKKTKRHRHQVPVILSTDITGILGFHPQLFYQLFHTISADCLPLDGVEFLPFRFSQQRLNRVLKTSQIPVVGIHAPIAWNTPDRTWPEKMFVAPFSLVAPSLSTAFNLTREHHPHYLLLHEPDLASCGVKNQLHRFLDQDNPPPILLENVYRPRSLQISIDQAKKLTTHTQTGVMIDLVHLLMEVMGIFSSFQNYHHHLTPTKIDRYWGQMLEQMDHALQQLHLAGIHLPIGTNRDSLPWNLLSTKHWRELVVLLDKHQDRLVAITLENQHPETILNLGQKHLPAIIKDKKNKLKTLLSCRVL